MRLDTAALTDIGRRKKKNEDSFGVFGEDMPDLRLFKEGALLVLADGLGGHIGGEIASKLVVSVFGDMLKEAPPEPGDEGESERMFALMREYVARANANVYQTNQDLVRGGRPMGTTLLAALLLPKKVYLVNVGDSRCYHIRDGEIIEMTEDHSWVDEQVKLGLMSRSEAESDSRRNVVTRSIGTNPDVAVDTYLWHVVPGDRLLLCSDGLVNMVPDNEIVAQFNGRALSDEIARRLVDMANENGGRDNITVIVTHIEPSKTGQIASRMGAFYRKYGLWLWLALAGLALVTAGIGLGMLLTGP